MAKCSISALRLYENGYAPAASPTRERIARVLAELEASNGQRAGSDDDGTSGSGGHALGAGGDLTVCDSTQHERTLGSAP